VADPVLHSGRAAGAIGCESGLHVG